MSGNYVFGSTTDRSSSNDGWIAQQATRRGDAFVADWVTHLAFEGRLFGTHQASGTTPVTFNATYAVAEQDLYLYVPSTVTVLPVSVAVGFEDTGTAQVLDVLAAISTTADSAVTGTALTIKKLRTDGAYASSCTATGVITGAGTDPTSAGYFEFWRPYMGFGEDAFNGSTGWVNQAIHGAQWNCRQAGFPVVISGGGSMSVYASGQAATGFLTAVWGEVPPGLLT